MSPAKVDRAAFSFQVPNTGSAARAWNAKIDSMISETIRTWLQCPARSEVARAGRAETGYDTFAPKRIRPYSRHDAPGRAENPDRQKECAFKFQKKTICRAFNTRAKSLIKEECSRGNFSPGRFD